MRSAHLLHHLGLGDHIIANGMVRYLSRQYDMIYLFCKKKNRKQVSHMFRDLKNIKLIIRSDNGVNRFIKRNKNFNYIIAGRDEFWKIVHDPKNSLTIEEIFYDLAGVPIKEKFQSFHIERDHSKEEQVFRELNLSKDEDYIFVHDDAGRPITKSLPSKKRIIRARFHKNHFTDFLLGKAVKNYSLFDYLKVIENSSEIHCLNSSFFCLIDTMRLKNVGNKRFLHEYARSDVGAESRPIFGLEWKIID